MEAISIKQTYNLLIQICSILNEHNITYLVYGSLARNLYSGNNNRVGDIDIIISEKDFSKLESLLNEHFNLGISKFNIHANSKTYNNEDGKPFDISLDSYEHYFIKDGIKFSDCSLVEVSDTKVKILSKEKLERLYDSYPKVKA